VSGGGAWCEARRENWIILADLTKFREFIPRYVMDGVSGAVDGRAGSGD
jgi:hypothetical protein